MISMACGVISRIEALEGVGIGFPFAYGDMLTGTGYELPNLATHSRRQTFPAGADSPLSATHQAVDVMEA